MWRWLLGVCLLWAGVAAQENPSCPDHCRCFWDQDNYKAAKCTAAAINPHFTDVFPSIQALNLRPLHRSQSVKLAPKIFHRFRNVKILNLSNCSIIQLPNDVFFGLRYTSDIDLSYNRIHSLNGLVFKSLPELQTLILRGNPLTLNSFSTIISNSLIELDMGECGLRTIPKETFAHVNRLTHLSLDGNHLATVYYQSIPNSLRYLNLAGNKIVNVPTKVLLSLSFLRRIDLSDNPVNCTCGLMLMQDWFSGRGVALENDVVCHLPAPYKGQNLNNINENELCKYELHQERHMNKLRFSSYKTSNTYHGGTEFNALPTYDVLMADQPQSGDTEVLYSNEDTRALGTHMENNHDKESSKSTTDNSEEGSGSDKEYIVDSAEEKHSKVLNSDESVRESSEGTSETPVSANSDLDNTLSGLGESSAQNSSSVEEENSSKNQSFEIDTPPEGDSSSFTETTHETTPHDSDPLTTTEEYESSGAGPLIIPDTSSKVDIIDEKETFSSTTESSTVEVSEETSEGSSTVSSITESSSESGSEVVKISSTHSESQEIITTEGPPETSTDSHDIHIPVTISSKEDDATSEPPRTSTTEQSVIVVEVTEPHIATKKVATEGLEHYSELSTEASVANGTDDVVARADTDEVAQSVTTYIIIAVIALPVIILILMAACRKKSPRKVRLPQDTESNLGTELQDMDTLLPKNGGTENGVKVVAKANGAANPADSKSPEEVAPVLQAEPEPEPEPPVVQEPPPPPSRQNGATTPIQKTKAKLTVIADSIPKTPVFIHKSFPE